MVKNRRSSPPCGPIWTSMCIILFVSQMVSHLVTNHNLIFYRSSFCVFVCVGHYQVMPLGAPFVDVLSITIDLPNYYRFVLSLGLFLLRVQILPCYAFSNRHPLSLYIKPLMVIICGNKQKNSVHVTRHTSLFPGIISH